MFGVTKDEGIGEDALCAGERRRRGVVILISFDLFLCPKADIYRLGVDTLSRIRVLVVLGEVSTRVLRDEWPCDLRVRTTLKRPKLIGSSWVVEE